jgi:ubiquinone biosynthesis protein
MPSVSSIPRIVRNAARLQQVVGVLTRFGVAPWLRRVPLRWVQRYLETSNGVAISELNGPERIREAITEVGTTFIKLGQILSTRPDVIGVELAEQLSQLQSHTPPDDTSFVRDLITAELGRPIDDLFATFDDHALASASIGQVHRATLQDGSQVVVKVQHSGIEQKIRNDLEIAMELAQLAQRYSEELALYQPVATVEELRRALLAELDFGQELRNLQAFGGHFQNDTDVRFPTAYPDLSTRRVLTMEYLEGIHVTSQDDITAAGFSPNEIAKRGANAFLSMLFRDGFFHADPHPGNLLLMPDGVVGIIDCGMVGRIDDSLREQIEDLLMAAADADVEYLVDIVSVLGELPADFDRNALSRDVSELFDQYACLPLDQIDIGDALNEAVLVVRKHRIRLPARVSMLIRMLAVLSHLLDIIPGDAADILDRIKQGRFDVHLEHRRLDVIINRLVLGIITAALYVGSSLLWSRSVPPLLGNYSIPGVLGTVAAIYLTIRLLRSIRDSGNI